MNSLFIAVVPLCLYKKHMSAGRGSSCYLLFVSSDSVNQQFISRRLVQKVIVNSRSGLSTYSFLSEPSRQPLLNHSSPLWQRAWTGALTLTSNQINVWSIMGLLPSGHLWIYMNSSVVSSRCLFLAQIYVCVSVCTQGNGIKGDPWSLGSFPSGFICSNWGTY